MSTLFSHIELPPPTDGPPRLARLGDIVDDLVAEAAAAYEAKVTGRPRGPVTGFERLDSELGGSLCPGLHVLHAAPGSGKTAFALQVAAQCGYPAVFVSCEMSLIELLRRHVARVTQTYLGRLRTGELPPDAVARLARHAAASAPNLYLADATHGWAPPTLLEEWMEVVAQDGRLLLVLDSVHSWSEQAQIEASEYDRLNLALGSLRSLAQRRQCPVLVIAERNRASMSSGGLSASAGSRRFEYQAESVLELNREGDGEPDLVGRPVPVTLRLAKNRNGSPGRRIPFTFNGGFQEFREHREP